MSVPFSGQVAWNGIGGTVPRAAPPSCPPADRRLSAASHRPRPPFGTIGSTALPYNGCPVHQLLAVTCRALYRSDFAQSSSMTRVRVNYDGWLALPTAVRQKLGLSTDDQ